MSQDYLALLKSEKSKNFPLDRTDKTDKTLLSVLSVPSMGAKNTFVSFVSSPQAEKKITSAGEETTIRNWLESIGETDPETIDEVLSACRRDAGARDYFLMRARSGVSPLDGWTEPFNKPGTGRRDPGDF